MITNALLDTVQMLQLLDNDPVDVSNIAFIWVFLGSLVCT